MIKDSEGKIVDNAMETLGKAVNKLGNALYKGLNNGRSYEDDVKDLHARTAQAYNQAVNSMNNEFMNTAVNGMDLNKMQNAMLNNMMSTMNNMTFS